VDLSFKLDELASTLPIILYYEGRESNSAMEKACADNGILTAGAMGSKIALPLSSIERATFGEKEGHKLFEAFNPLTTENRAVAKELLERGNKLTYSVCVSARQARALANELRLATGILVGPTSARTVNRLESTGIVVSRVSLLEEISRAVDVPVIATATSPTDVVKALIAGADAALINFGGPFEAGDNLEFAVKAVAAAIRENLTDLCHISGAKTVKHLSTRCSLVPR
jgi:hypothetical protein